MKNKLVICLTVATLLMCNGLAFAYETSKPNYKAGLDIALVAQPCSAYEQEISYPVKLETLNEIQLLLSKFFECEDDLEALTRIKTQDEVPRAVFCNKLIIYSADISGVILSVQSMLLVERAHGLDGQYNSRAMSLIMSLTEKHTSRLSNLDKINEFMGAANSDLLLFQCAKLKEYTRETGRLMQKAVKELRVAMEAFEYR